MDGVKGHLPASPEKAPDATTQRRNEIAPIALEIIKRIAAREEKFLGFLTGEEDDANDISIAIFSEEIIPLLMEKNIKIVDIPYLFQLVLQPFQLFSQITTNSFEVNRDLAEARFYGLKDVRDLRVMDLDEALKNPPKDKISTEEKKS